MFEREKKDFYDPNIDYEKIFYNEIFSYLLSLFNKNVRFPRTIVIKKNSQNFYCLYDKQILPKEATSFLSSICKNCKKDENGNISYSFKIVEKFVYDGMNGASFKVFIE